MKEAFEPDVYKLVEELSDINVIPSFRSTINNHQWTI